MVVLNVSDDKCKFDEIKLLKEYTVKVLLKEGLSNLKSGKVIDGKLVFERLRTRIS